MLLTDKQTKKSCFISKLNYCLTVSSKDYYRQRKFFGMSRSELHKLNLKHEKTLKRLKKASNHKAKGNSINLDR